MHRKKRMFAKKLIHNLERNLWISLRYAICETLRNVDFTCFWQYGKCVRMVLCKVDKSNVSNINMVSKRLKSAICCVLAYQHVDKLV